MYVGNGKIRIHVSELIAVTATLVILKAFNQLDWPWIAVIFAPIFAVIITLTATLIIMLVAMMMEDW